VVLGGQKLDLGLQLDFLLHRELLASTLSVPTLELILGSHHEVGRPVRMFIAVGLGTLTETRSSQR
jgi:hypothetical protein